MVGGGGNVAVNKGGDKHTIVLLQVLGVRKKYEGVGKEDIGQSIRSEKKNSMIQTTQVYIQ